MNAIERATGPRHACKSASTSTSELPSIPARLEALNYIGLPAELRLKTIRYTMEEPQNVGIDFFTGTTYEIAKSPPPRRFTPIPIALHLNRESRIEALKHYEVLLFHSIPDNWKSSCPTIYINKAVDTLTVELKPQTDSHSWEEASMLVECIKFIDFPRSRLVVSMSEENDWLSKIRGMESWQLDDKSFREGYDKTCTAIVKKLAVFARELYITRIRFGVFSIVTQLKLKFFALSPAREELLFI
ncbi:hypothetical protein M7I_4711 [Glarea lozoyensis 74030]|uniref:2EXR domain-containing protein n=1 Tax=Glarea lozoyensis (strain ATCC 74030 / MF5533) TaxID=1104152 RepID=H0EPX3_GLAL7|nr:hypothetical protein M7I_4711 [Glarea lozoyensis 74030]